MPDQRGKILMSEKFKVGILGATGMVFPYLRIIHGLRL